MKTEWVTLSIHDGTSAQAYVARPSNEPAKAGLIVFQEVFGVNPHIRDITERFAKEGYLAIAPDVFHRTGERFEAAYTDYQATATHRSALTPEGLVADAEAVFTWLKNEGVEHIG